MPLPAFGRSRSKSKAAHTPHPHRDDRGDRDDRDETAAAATDSDVDDHELSSYLAALAPEADPESTGSGRFGEADVHQLRLSHVAGQQLRDVAAERGTSPRALAEEWVLERLAWEAQGTAEPHPAPQAPQAPQAPAPQTPQEQRTVPHDPATRDVRRPAHQRQAPQSPAWPAPDDAFPGDVAPAPHPGQAPHPGHTPQAPHSPQAPRPAQAPEAPAYGRDDEPATEEIFLDDLRHWEAQVRGSIR